MRIRSEYPESHGDALGFTFSGQLAGDEMGGELDMGEYLKAQLDGEAARREGGLSHVPEPLALAASLLLVAVVASAAATEPKYDLLLRGGHVIDPKSGTSAVRDVAIAGGKIAAVAPRIDPALAFKVVDVKGLYVTPGLIDLHVHVYTGTGEKGSYAGDNSLYPDGFTLRSGVTTVVDAGCAGWRNFADFKDRVIDRSRTRVLAMLNIVGNGMRGGKFEQDLADMDAEADRRRGAAAQGPRRRDQDRPLRGGRLGARSSARSRRGPCAGVPVMVDFGASRPERPIAELVAKKLRPGDIYTHCYSGLRVELEDAGRSTPRWRRAASAACCSTSATAAAASRGGWRCPRSRRASCPTRSRPTSTSAA